MWVFSKVQDYTQATQAPAQHLPESEERAVVRQPESKAAALKVCLESKLAGQGPVREWAPTVQERRAHELRHSLGPRHSQTRLVHTR